MKSKRIGEPCPKCATRLMRRKAKINGDVGEVAYCARCNAAFEIAVDEPVLMPFAPEPQAA